VDDVEISVRDNAAFKRKALTDAGREITFRAV
jgi:hypothetical protein